MVADMFLICLVLLYIVTGNLYDYIAFIKNPDITRVLIIAIGLMSVCINKRLFKRYVCYMHRPDYTEPSNDKNDYEYDYNDYT